MMLQIWRVVLIYEVLKSIRFSNRVMIPLYDIPVRSRMKINKESLLMIVLITLLSD